MASLKQILPRLPKGGPEHQALEAGEIDAIIDHAGRNVILLPTARRALREMANRTPPAIRAVANQAPTANGLLAALPHAEYRRLLAAGLEPVTLKFGEVLHEPGVPFRYVYFPVDCVISLLTAVGGHQALEVALVGHEGMVGISLALGSEVSLHRAVVQGTGTAMRMEAGSLRGALLQSKPLQQALHRFKHALVGQISQSAACNRFHSVEARLARYLLMSCDRARSTEICFGHEFLASMLGVRRVGVTIAVGALRKRKLIKCGREKITILDRRHLGAASCECYQIIKRIYDSAYADG
ncbi:MAG TPA: Crp/Fnr family transcriptional regulator [Burkholderiales bacterium]|nr:Crp/Fnr family transcriptional regulator [Burkholderiales bacterium]